MNAKMPILATIVAASCSSTRSPAVAPVPNEPVATPTAQEEAPEPRDEPAPAVSRPEPDERELEACENYLESVCGPIGGDDRFLGDVEEPKRSEHLATCLAAVAGASDEDLATLARCLGCSNVCHDADSCLPRRDERGRLFVSDADCPSEDAT